ncbi:MAG TPA: hypothetical protein VIK27_05425 [Candidatus Aquilonibacter sp.]
MDWSIVMYVGVGLGALLVGIAALVACLALAGTLGRVNKTLDVVDGQITALSKPIGETLDHVGGIADTADQTLARLRGVVGALEKVSVSLSNVADLAKEALSPAIVNVGATIAGVSAGLRRIVTGRTSNDKP